MPAVRRVRVAVIAVIFVFASFFFLTNRSTSSWSDSLPAQLQSPPEPPIHWEKLPDRYPVSSLKSLPKGPAIKIPKVQSPPPEETSAQERERLGRRDAVKDAFRHSWEGYKNHAWLKDELTPLSGRSRNTFGGWAATLVDSLDSLWIMGIKDDFEMALGAIEEIDFTSTDTREINVFETTIRYLGGFLAANDISGGKYPILLSKAVEVGELLMCCFDTPNRMPIPRWNWRL